ncbi:hypothetical protein VNO77_08454 [Canavalia gladiata]|uniref:Uncharacterized protein n=1 Tax=Canavalia gladiata TaxID=3824 RepID=A0AAN9M8H8_CANGL
MMRKEREETGEILDFPLYKFPKKLAPTGGSEGRESQDFRSVFSPSQNLKNRVQRFISAKFLVRIVKLLLDLEPESKPICHHLDQRICGLFDECIVDNEVRVRNLLKDLCIGTDSGVRILLILFLTRQNHAMPVVLGSLTMINTSLCVLIRKCLEAFEAQAAKCNSRSIFICCVILKMRVMKLELDNVVSAQDSFRMGKRRETHLVHATDILEKGDKEIHMLALRARLFNANEDPSSHEVSANETRSAYKKILPVCSKRFID